MLTALIVGGVILPIGSQALLDQFFQLSQALTVRIPGDILRLDLGAQIVIWATSTQF